MSNWQVQCSIAVNVDDCESGDEAIERVRLCMPSAKMPSVKPMKVLCVEKAISIERSGRGAGNERM